MEARERRGIAAMMVVAGIVDLAQRPLFLLIVAVILYHNCYSIFGVRPLSPNELTELLFSVKEVTIAAAGLVVAIASITAFKHVKRLDLELAASNDITSISRDASSVLTRYALYCEKILEIKARYASRYDRNMSREARALLDDELDAEWQVLLKAAGQIDDQRDAVWSILRRLAEIGEKHQAVIGSRIVTPILLELAQSHLEKLANAAVFPVPKTDQKLLEYIRAFMLNGVKPVRDYLEVDSSHRLKVLGYLGGASSIGSSSIAPSRLLKNHLMCGAVRPLFRSE